MSQGGANSNSGSGGLVVETLTGNSGGTVSPDADFNTDILGNNSTGINVIGTPASNLLTITGIQSSTSQQGTTEYATAIETGILTDSTRSITPAGLEPILVTPYVVAPNGAYTTIQSALDAANAAGGGTVWVRHGSYTEDLTFYDNIEFVGDSEQGTFITGTHTPPTSGTLNIFRFNFIDSTAIFSSAAAGTATIICEDITVNVTNGYTFDLLNWTGTIAIDNFGNAGTNDGFIRNTGGATFACFFSGLGSGSTNTMTLSGTTIITTSDNSCPMEFVTGASVAIDNCAFDNSLTFSNNSTGTIANTRISSGASSAITMSSSSNFTLASCQLDSSNNPAIAGAGAGTLTLSNISFLNNSAIAGTLTLGSSSVYPTDMSNGELLIGSTGQPAVSSTLTAGTGISITNGAGSITIDSTVTGTVTGPGSSTDNALARWNGTGGTILQDSTVTVSDNGEMTNTFQPAFLAYLATSANNKTGNGTVYTLGSDSLTIVYDQNSDFTVGGVFTAPVTGKYEIHVVIEVTQAAGANNYTLNIITSNRTYSSSADANVNTSGFSQYKLSTLADMDALDTATFNILVNGVGADTTDIYGSSTLFTYVCGTLIC